VGGPEDAGLALGLRRLGLEVQRGVPAPGVDPDDPRAQLVEAARRLGRHARALDHVVGRVQERVAAGADQDDVERLDVAVQARERVVDLRDGDRVAVLLVGEVEHHAGRVKPLERQLVDGQRALAGDRRVVVPRRVDVRGVVGAEADELLGRPALAVAQQLRSDAEHRVDRRGPGLVALEDDLRAQRLRRVGRAVLDRSGQVDEARHGGEPYLTAARDSSA